MRDPDEFDEFYKATQHRLLVQTFALTGDLATSRNAVRDAYVAAWHHWRKVSRLEDRQAWVRPLAWAHAQRRHTAKLRHRDKDVDWATRSTLDALAKLTGQQRRVLLINKLTDLSIPDLAREVGVTDEAAEQLLADASRLFTKHRDVAPAEVRDHLEALAQSTRQARFPRPSIIRRAGAARRRLHTGVGIAAALTATVVTGTVAAQGVGVAPVLGDLLDERGSGAGADDQLLALRTTDLLTRRQAAAVATPTQVGGVVTPRKMGVATTDDNTAGDGLYVVCQRDRFADPNGLATLVRRFPIDGAPALSAIQSVELSASLQAAEAAYVKSQQWFAGCRAPRVQLLSTYDVTGTGDAASLLVLRSWTEPVATYTVGLARTGAITTTVVRQAAGGAQPDLGPMLHLLAMAVGGLCDHAKAGACPGQVAHQQVPPPAAESDRGLLQVVDLPPVTNVVRPWVGTDPITASVNSAATRCDKASFTGPAVTRSLTRSFLIPGARVPKAFGLTETVGVFADPTAAAKFVKTIRKRMAGCEDKDLATTLQLRHKLDQGDTQLSIWRVTTEVSDKKTFTFDMAIMRTGNLVAQLGFVPGPGAKLADGAFHALADRTLARLQNLPQ